MSIAILPSSSLRSWLLPPAAVLGAALGLVGCTRNLDSEALKKSISDGLTSQLGLSIESVVCPPDRPIKAGDVLECTATPLGGGRLTIKVTQKDDTGNVDWEVAKTEGLLDLGTVEASIATGLKEQAGVEASASCGGRWRAAKAGDTFDCEAKTATGEAVAIVVSVQDDEGNISWSTK